MSARQLGKTLPICVGILALVPAARLPAQESVEESLVVDISFEADRWTVNRAVILPCPGPHLPDYAGPNATLIRALDDRGEEVIRRSFRNPRLPIVHDEHDRRILDSLRFGIVVPYRVGTTTFELWEFASDVETIVPRDVDPSIRLDLTAVVADYEAQGGASQDAPCRPGIDFSQYPLTPPDAVRAGGGSVRLEEAVSPWIRGIIESPDRAFDLAIRTGVEPDSLRRWVEQVDDPTLRRLRVTRRELERLLQQYEQAYSEAGPP